jgi:hypothetical protein
MRLEIGFERVDRWFVLAIVFILVGDHPSHLYWPLIRVAFLASDAR